MTARRLIVAFCALLAALAVAGCGNDDEPGIDEPAREGLAIEMGGIDYNVFITRQLNPQIQPDEAYYAGPPAPKGQLLYGVFLEACNVSKEPQTTAETFTVTDNQGEVFEPTPLPEDNQFAYHAKRLDPEECIPEAGSVAQLGPTEGAMLLFQFPLEKAENRPLELEIENPSGGDPSRITFELDL
jgi:hypothetical protein